jgi:hypothetical protein
MKLFSAYLGHHGLVAGMFGFSSPFFDCTMLILKSNSIFRILRSGIVRGIVAEG